jgi:hypothetical protein
MVGQFPRLVNSGKPIAAKNRKTGFQREMLENDHYGFEWAFRYQFFAAGASLNRISPIFWLKPLNCFLQFKEQALFKLKNQLSAVQCKRKTF